MKSFGIRTIKTLYLDISNTDILKYLLCMYKRMSFGHISYFIYNLHFNSCYIKLMTSQSKFSVSENFLWDISSLGWILTLRYRELKVHVPYKFYVLGQIGLSKQCRPRSDCFWRSSLIRVYAVCHSISIFWMHYTMLHQTFLFLGQLWQLFEVSQILEFLRYQLVKLYCCQTNS